MESRSNNNNDPQSRGSNFRRRVFIGAAVIGSLGAGLGANALAGGSEGVPCDPVIDGGCVPNEEGVLPTLPDKDVTTTVPETTTTTVPETTTTTQPETTTTTLAPPPPEQPPVTTTPPPPSVGKST